MIPSVVGATIEAFKMLDESRDLIDKLKLNSKLLRGKLVAAGFTMMGVEESPIAPIWLGDTTLCRNI
jgi:7-keto-8-aminopelargonate synthetase-like enzyme